MFFSSFHFVVTIAAIRRVDDSWLTMAKQERLKALGEEVSDDEDEDEDDDDEDDDDEESEDEDDDEEEEEKEEEKKK
jgi:hypothetical protein